MKTLLIFIGLAICVALMTGCEWTTGGNVESWNTSQFGTNAADLDFSGVYKASDGGILVRAFGSTTSTNQVSGEQIGTGTGSATAFSGILAHAPVPGTLTITVGAYRFTDSGSSTSTVGTVNLSVTPADGSAGTFNYGTHVWTLTFPAPIASGTPILANYYYLGDASQGNHGKAIYSLVVYQTGNRLQMIDSNNSSYDGTVGVEAASLQVQFSATGVSQGYKVTVVGMFQLNGTTRTMNATFIEDGGSEADIKGVKQ